MTTTAAQFVLAIQFTDVKKNTKIDYECIAHIIAGAIIHLRNGGVIQSCCEPPTQVERVDVTFKSSYPVEFVN